ncbi:MAG: hypothetical protein WCG87_13235, partial [Bacteroidota bacterium]
LKLVNNKIESSCDKIRLAGIVEDSSVNEHNSLQQVIDKYRSILVNKYGENVPKDEEVYFMKLV